jgi:predicted kinase
LILVRGLPGAGKTTLAKVLAEDRWPVFSIDAYFTDPDTGEYNFDFSKNHLAYKHCSEQAESAMKNGIQKVFVDNTFTLEWELEPYFALAKKYQYKLFVVTTENRHGGQNSHGVSQEQLEKMAAKYNVKLF